MASRSRKPSARDVVADLLRREPVNEGDLARRLKGVSRGELRREIVDVAFGGGASPGDTALLCAALLEIGAQGEEDRLERIAADVRRDRAERSLAVSLLFSVSQERVDRVLMGLEPDDMLKLTLQPAAAAVGESIHDPEAPSMIADALSGAPDGVRDTALDYLEEARRASGAPAALVYREALGREELGRLRARLLEAVVEEGGAEAAAVLTELRDSAKDPAARQDLQRALLRLGTRAIEAPAEPSAVRGKAYVGNCDGQGAFVLLGCFEGPGGKMTIADLCIRAGADVRDGFCSAGAGEADLAELLEKLREGAHSDFALLSLGEAASIALAGAERTRRAGVPIPEDARPALMLFERARVARAEAGGEPAPRGPVTPAEARALLALPGYKHWWFDAGDFGGAGVAPPPSGRKGRAKWIEGALARLEAAEVRPRLTAMLEHMARWHALRGEREQAEIAAASARESNASFRTGALPRAMVERSITILRNRSNEPAGSVGDPEVRDRLRLELFRDVDDPRGRDLALLDFTEAALDALWAALEVLPGSHRPREDDLPRAAFALASAFTPFVISRKPKDPALLFQEMQEALAKTTKLDPGERALMASQVLPALVGFAQQFCDGCPVACLARPKADVADAFFAPEHPALG